MNHWTAKRVSALVLLAGVIALPTATIAADDPKTPAKDPPTKAPDFSQYVFVKDMTGEVVKADEKKISITIKYTVNKQPNPKARPALAEMHQDYEFQMIPESLVRTEYLPPKTDEKGKKVAYTQKEKDNLKLPKPFPGYAASVSDLTPGTLVEIRLIRDKSISEAKATDQDLRVKYAVIKSPPPTPATPPNKN
jgi:hypothetical protein